ncbi:PREDICTED: contactin-associated protein-like 5 [Branchiostoma belcheri]|uniref:Contactin-associated protein-like 5 n=1 Tax=Branchiostoma belcheri TaxID=7741 RepID=A0A6P4Y037_BRABE|nr:PREDICTED: contactin-associated protein-like 5 [Branchiostoma belcheri]
MGPAGPIGPQGLPGRAVCPAGRTGTPAKSSARADTQISELQSNYQELTEQTSGLRQQNEDLEKRLSVLEKHIRNTTHSDSTGYPPSSCTEVAERSGIDDQTFYVIDPDGPRRGVLPMLLQGCDILEQHGPSECCGGPVISLQTAHQVIWEHRPVAWWVTWDGRQADYWGGASPGSGKCACGQTGTCQGRCNCDVNVYTWREDSGFLSHKNDLPVAQLRFGDTGDGSEDGYHTLGKLICYP